MAGHYVNNGDFLEALVEYKQKVKDALENDRPRPQVTNYIGECILKIATHISYKPNFINYTYREEMISDGIENCLVYIDNFDPAKSSNPFAYFTQIIYYAFLRRIEREKKQTYIKGKIIMNMPFDSFDIQDHDEDEEFTSSYVNFMQNHSHYNDAIEKVESKRAARKKKKIPTLEEMLDSDEVIHEIEKELTADE